MLNFDRIGPALTFRCYCSDLDPMSQCLIQNPWLRLIDNCFRRRICHKHLIALFKEQLSLVLYASCKPLATFHGKRQGYRLPALFVLSRHLVEGGVQLKRRSNGGNIVVEAAIGDFSRQLSASWKSIFNLFNLLLVHQWASVYLDMFTELKASLHILALNFWFVQLWGSVFCRGSL